VLLPRGFHARCSDRRKTISAHGVTPVAAYRRRQHAFTMHLHTAACQGQSRLQHPAYAKSRFTGKRLIRTRRARRAHAGHTAVRWHAGCTLHRIPNSEAFPLSYAGITQIRFKGTKADSPYLSPQGRP